MPLTPTDSSPRRRVAIIGAGPAGLMAAQTLIDAKLAGQLGTAPALAPALDIDTEIDVYDAMPSVGRKFLLAGIGGLNLTHSEPQALFKTRYGSASAALEPWLDAFGPEATRAWAHSLGSDTFVGTSGRVFPTSMKAAPLLRAWLHRLRQHGVRFHMRHRWTGWADAASTTASTGTATDATTATLNFDTLNFATPNGPLQTTPDATLLALGGGSWARLGSDGAWVPWLQARGIAVAPLQAANCGFNVAWSPFFTERFAGHPFKSVAIRVDGEEGGEGVSTADGPPMPPVFERKGEFIATATGLEGSLIYAASALLRERITRHGSATFHLDLLPHKTPEQVLSELTHPRGSRSLSSHLKSRLGLDGIKSAILHERVSKADFADPQKLAKAIKSVPIRVDAPRPIDEAISTAGGVAWAGLDAGGMLQAHPGLFCAGEMLDWEAPTGGYLLTACLASGRAAGAGVVGYLARG